ncbi:MAG: hypothetical protein LIO77_07015 [Rikenellaceae bacterium]|nr:hypothetical protein [Rikenellaceae bacterium]
MDAELIIILVAVGLSILSGVNKAKKKKAEVGHSSPGQAQPREDDDPWATIRKYIEEAQNDDRQPQPAKEANVQVRHIAREENPNTNAARKTLRDKEGKSRNRGREEIDPIPEITMESNDFLEDFDLQKAVIYSEILKPKYEDIY